MSADPERHQRACDGFTALVRAVEPTQWGLPTPCEEWDTRALLEHVIGIHEYLLLRPLGVRTRRPKDDPCGRWVAAARAVAAVLDGPEVLDQPRDYFDGAVRRPGAVLPALTTETLVHTWDLARAVGSPSRLAPELCRWAGAQPSSQADATRVSGLYAPALEVPVDAPSEDRLVARLGRSPAWRPAAVGPGDPRG